MEDFKKVVRLGTTDIGNRRASVYIKIKLKKDALSISGVEGPLPSGNALGGCGQIDMHMDAAYVHGLNFAKGWNSSKVRTLLDIWKRWHLNDMKAGCVHQTTFKWEEERIPIEELPNSQANRDKLGIIATWVTEKEHPKGLLSKPCPICGYKYGSAWNKEEIPTNVIDFLKGLPETDQTPAWV